MVLKTTRLPREAMRPWTWRPFDGPDRRLRPAIRRLLIGGLMIGLAPAGATSASDAATAHPLSWSVVRSPNRGVSDNLAAVSCLSAASCTAVGSAKNVGRYVNLNGHDRTLIESWNGSRWSVVPSPNPGSKATPSALASIFCVSAGDCLAAGNSGSGPAGPSRTLIEAWNGSSWAVVPSPNEGPASDFDFLGGVSCPSARFCMGVGRFSNINDVSKTLAETGTAAAHASALTAWPWSPDCSTCASVIR